MHEDLVILFQLVNLIRVNPFKASLILILEHRPLGLRVQNQLVPLLNSWPLNQLVPLLNSWPLLE